MGKESSSRVVCCDVIVQHRTNAEIEHCEFNQINSIVNRANRERQWSNAVYHWRVCTIPFHSNIGVWPTNNIGPTLSRRAKWNWRHCTKGTRPNTITGKSNNNHIQSLSFPLNSLPRTQLENWIAYRLIELTNIQ